VKGCRVDFDSEGEKKAILERVTMETFSNNVKKVSVDFFSTL
jgi:hypothetical protein